MINPIALQVGPVAVRWYGISYGVALFLGILITIWLNKKRQVFKDKNQIYDFAFWIFILGVIIGGRLGYVLFYNLPFYISNPLKIFAIWEGGMSFHGGLIGVAIVSYFFCKKNKIGFFDLGDIAVIPGALALTFTRIANFINHELVGRPIGNMNFRWLGVDFGDGILRYPSQLFQAADSLILFLILLLIFSRKPKKGVIMFCYIGLYGLFRFIVEFWRAPDPQVGYIWHYFTLGQILSLLMAVICAGGLIFINKRKIFK